MKYVGAAVIAAAIIGGGAFWGGMAYAQNKSGSIAASAQAFGGRNFGAGNRGFRNGGSGAVFGKIVAKDASSITVQLGGPNATSTNGTQTGSKIVLYSDSTQVGKFVQGTTDDLSVGDDITAMGTPNSDGSITAAQIQIRPADIGPRGN